MSARLRLWLFAAAICTAPASHIACAQTSTPLVLEAGMGRVVNLPGISANVFVADPKVVEVRPASARTLFVFGLAEGRTSIAALNASGHTLALYNVTVGPATYAARTIDRSVARAMPDAHVTAVPNGSGVTLTGRVASPSEAERAMIAAQSNIPAAGHVVNDLGVDRSTTVGLKVRITEMTRQITRALGVDWTAMGTIGQFALNFATSNGIATTLSSLYSNGHGASVDTVLEALATDNLVHVLAEPNLTARSGESASFLVGGEYPIPVPQGGTSDAITIEYKQYGVSLSFVPTVLSSGRISLHVRPEVSQISTSPSAGAVSEPIGSGSISIPALTVRRAETTVELGSGQTFAIAGLLQDSTTQANNLLPGLGELPIIGALFRSDSFQHNQTELVIIVTPYIVGSATDPDAVQDAGVGYTPPNDIERVLLLRQHGDRPPIPVPGNAGFIIE